ncbi:hypothetical protein EUX98_g7257 [Antrodiella citrinella]|uniref:Uncharacterized protein n=1 Tax=Antrodiella citrinella TaxID=2447956 RepID=A0A4S4MLY4_9APHY|nr:hypothetical protein EUX98_g7257 [Antrodiella citrinella]
MARTSRYKFEAAARARSGLAATRQRAATANKPPNIIIIDSDSDSESEIIILQSPHSQPVQVESQPEECHSPQSEPHCAGSCEESTVAELEAAVQSESHAHSESDSETEDCCTLWTGGVNHNPDCSDSGDSDWDSEDNESGSEHNTTDSEGAGMEVELLEDDELLNSLQDELQKLLVPTPYEELLNTNQHQWKKAERQRWWGYNGNSERTKRDHAKKLRDKEKVAEKMRKR